MLQVRHQAATRRIPAGRDFDAPVPGVTALFGRSGCGKTTLVNLLAGLLREGADAAVAG